MRAENLMIVQGGGPTAVFNASLASVIAEGIAQPRIGKVFGARSGMKGLAEGDVIELSQMTPHELRALRNSPGAALGSSRFKPEDEDLERCVALLRRMEVRHLVFMGGNGTMRGAELVGDFCRERGFEVGTVGVPKTIDNDIAATDRCPGFGSAARYMAQSTRDLGMDLRSLPQPLSILETMGRDVGWIAAASTLAKDSAEDAPHLVYLPEIAFERERFLKDVETVMRRQGWGVIVVSEGIRYADGTPVYEQKSASQKDPLSRPLIGGVAQFLSGVVAEELGIRCRSEKPGLLGRASLALVSPQDQADAEVVGREGVRALLAGETGQMVSLLPLEQAAPAAVRLVSLSEAAGVHRGVPAAWLSGGPLAVSDGFREYARPLVGKLLQYPAALAAAPQSMGVV